ncbi:MULTISPECIES: hypothetical protein [Gordonibacter]|uniref:Uncharacterized protein n=1 Tax=Gordonibacter faecis TaxID=3047475 RepID=A0ABT7DLW5_9ACTN|nr:MULTISPECIES: hypothetical protein [unclassified Gordonibacter]MDJ1650513.1 hypothetical protein [Gordonibacter sp. KGMB12511]HIW76385.1 hypothetical protein [Candidatus Gordonibacter avicola]
MTWGVDAATAFARLYHRWFDDAAELIAENAREARTLKGSFVADVLTLWDMDARAWLPGAPTILRLETCDLAVFTMRAPHLALFFGSIDTDSPAAAFGPSLRWESFRPCSYAIGRTVSDLVFTMDENSLLTGIEAVLDDGGRLALGNPATWELPCAG